MLFTPAALPRAAAETEPMTEFWAATIATETPTPLRISGATSSE
jgi:hypothetical protein